MGREEKKKYEHFIPPARPNPDFPDKYSFICIESIDVLRDVLGKAEKVGSMAFDTETSSLDPTKGYIVGYSFCFENDRAYYVPVKTELAVTKKPVLGKEALDLLYQSMLKMKTVFVFNMRFDFRYMEYSGYDMSLVKYYDVAIGVWLADTNKKMPGLKWAAGHFLGWKMSTFEETLGDSTNFSYIDPEDAYKYAAADALSTWNLIGATAKYYVESKSAGKIDNELLYPLMKFENNRLAVDVEYAALMGLELDASIAEVAREIYQSIGTVINLKSPKQLGTALSNMGYDTGKYTKTGQMKVDIESLEEMKGRYDEDNTPVLIDKIVEYARLNKLNNSYVSKLKEHAEKNEGTVRFSYNTVNVPTGRLSCSGDKENTFFAHINAQSMPKPHPKEWFVHEDPNGILGYSFSDEPSEYVVEGANPVHNIRNAFKADDGCYWVTVDFQAQELRIPTNFCIDGSTEITLGDYSKVSMKVLREMLKSGKVKVKTPVGDREVENFFDCGKHVSYKVCFEGGSSLVCSGEHKFLVNSGGRVEFKKLLDIDLENDYILDKDDIIEEKTLREALMQAGD